MNKAFYRASFNECKKYVKLGILCDEVGIPRSSMSMFLKGEEFDYQISLFKLDLLYKLLCSICRKFT